jgi:hypothetical protein
MVDEIVFHLGDCKTGTTSVQTVLARGAWTLGGQAGSGIAYPARVNHIPLAKTLSVPAEAAHEAERFGAVREAFEQSDAAHGIISAEHFEFVDPEAVARAIDRHFGAWQGRIRLVAYVRPHADRLVSTFAERSKKGLFMQPLAAMHNRLVDDRLLFYTPRFEKWRALFGEAFTLRPFLRDRLWQGDVVQDFFHYVLGGDGFEITRPTDQNESLSVEDIAMMRAIHTRIRKRHPELRATQQSLGWYLSDLLGKTPHPEGTKPRLHRVLADQVVATYAEDAAALDAAFFDGTPMSDALARAPEKAIEAPQSFDAETYFSASEQRLFTVWARLFARMMAADPDHFAWSVRPPEQRAPTPPKRARRAGKGGAARKGPGKSKGGKGKIGKGTGVGAGRRQAAP